MDKSRRRFFGDVARTAGGAALIGLGLGVYARKAESLPAEARCGLCVRSCPYDTLKLARFEHAIQTGTPYFTAREIPCEMCEDIPCIEACPTGALDPGMTDIDEARMGIAVLVDQENCLNFLGLRCDVCHRVCPLIDEAITIERQHNARSGRHAFMLPTVHAEACTGCGKCEYACVLPEAAIKVLPQHLARGVGGDHYRLGWEEKQRAGESLVPGDPDHEYHLPEGLDYDYEGDGLIREEPLETPFPDDPLETLNQGANP
jgi:ferredoxin-type protein NapG